MVNILHIDGQVASWPQIESPIDDPCCVAYAIFLESFEVEKVKGDELSMKLGAKIWMLKKHLPIISPRNSVPPITQHRASCSCTVQQQLLPVGHSQRPQQRQRGGAAAVEAMGHGSQHGGGSQACMIWSHSYP